MGTGAGSTDDPDRLAQVAGMVADAARIVVLTGAGISTESGIPDYRGPQGVWTQNPKAERMSTIGDYLADPEVRQLAWRFRAEQAVWRRDPNPAHRALVDLERAGKLSLLVTQNVDGLHAKAGTSQDRLVEIHGTVRLVRCQQCKAVIGIEDAISRVEAGEADPPCRSCGSILRPAVVFFGEGLVEEDLARAVLATRDADLFLAAGSSLQVFPAAGLPQLAVESGIPLVVANAEPTPFDDVAAAVLRGRLGSVLPAIVQGDVDPPR